MKHQARKRFGQNFLHDTGVVDRIVRAIAPDPQQPLVEIGPGLGALTNPLLEAGALLHVVELDRDLVARLVPLAAANPRLQVHSGDALKFDFAALAARLGARLRVIGNLPYNISTPLLFRLLEQIEAIVDMHFMLQSEVVDRLAAAPDSPSYGRLSVMVQLYCEVERLFRVGPGAFRPAPRVDSAIVRLRPRPALAAQPGDIRLFAEIVRHAFGQRRKTLRNALRPLAAAATIAEAGVDPGARAETIDVAGFAALSRLLTRQRSEAHDA